MPRNGHFPNTIMLFFLFPYIYIHIVKLETYLLLLTTNTSSFYFFFKPLLPIFKTKQKRAPPILANLSFFFMTIKIGIGTCLFVEAVTSRKVIPCCIPSLSTKKKKTREIKGNLQFTIYNGDIYILCKDKAQQR